MSESVAVSVTHIAKSLSSEWLTNTFSECGPVVRMDHIMAAGSTNSAVVHFSTLEEAQTAVRELNGTKVNGSVLKVILNKESEGNNSSTTPQTRQVSPTPALGELKFCEHKQSIFQSPPVVGLKLKTGESTATPSSDFTLSLLDKPNPEPSSSTHDSDDHKVISEPLSSFSFIVPKDHIPKMTTSKLEPLLSDATSSNSSVKKTMKCSDWSSSHFHRTTGTGCHQRVSPTPMKQTQAPYKSKSLSSGCRATSKVSPTPKRSREKEEGSKMYRHHPYQKKSHSRSLSQGGGKFKHTISQFSLSSSSTDNPFLKDLKPKKKTPSLSVPSDATGVVSNPPRKDFSEQQTKSISLPDSLVCKLLAAHPQVVAELQALSKANGVTCSVVDDSSSLLTLSGFQIDIKKCEQKVTELIQCVQQEIIKESVAVHCMYIPFLASPAAVGQLEGIADKNCVQIVISLPSSGQDFSSIKDFSTSYNERDANSLLQTSKLQHLTAPDIPLDPQQPAVWSYSLGGVITVQHSALDSEMIENTFRYGGPPSILTYNNDLHSFNFFEMAEKLYQINLQTGERLSLVRSPSIAPRDDGTVTPEYMMNLLLRGLPDCIMKAKNEISEMLQVATCEHEHELQLTLTQDQQKLSEFLLVMVNYARQYCILLKPIDFKENGKVILKFDSTREYGESVKLELMKHSLELQSQVLTHVAQTRVPLLQHPQQAWDFPDEWENQTFDPELKDVSPDSSEWKKVLAEMLKTMSKVQMKKLQRIQNRRLWEKYALESNIMLKRNSGEINEKGLFHGTRTIDPLTVVQSEKGVDFRYSNEDRNLWGKGSYFAVNASYSDKYSYCCENDDKQMLLVRVLTGKSYECEEPRRDFIKPPLLNPVSSKSYDTVTSSTGGSQIYVVYEHDKSYPAYLITYRSL